MKPDDNDYLSLGRERIEGMTYYAKTDSLSGWAECKRKNNIGRRDEDRNRANSEMYLMEIKKMIKRLKKLRKKFNEK